jgi:hypothetical protein
MLAGDIFNGKIDKIAFTVTTLLDIEGIPEDPLNVNDAAPPAVNV